MRVKTEAMFECDCGIWVSINNASFSVFLRMLVENLSEAILLCVAHSLWGFFTGAVRAKPALSSQYSLYFILVVYWKKGNFVLNKDFFVQIYQ